MRRLPLLRSLLGTLVLALAGAAAAHGQAADTVGTTPADSVTAPATASGALQRYHEAYYVLDALNPGLAPPSSPLNLQTPQAALEAFVRAARDGRYDDAAHALNLNLLPAAEQAPNASRVAERLYYVLDQQLGFDWEGLPDRPDGQAPPTTGGSDPAAGEPRRSLLLGSIPLGARDAAVRLQRVKVGDQAPVWVVSPQTVASVDRLYRRYGPGPVERLMPSWARTQVIGLTPLWAWIGLLALAVLAGLGAVWIHGVARRRLGRVGGRRVRSAASNVATPVAAASALLFLYLTALILLRLPSPVTRVLLVLLVAAVTWLAVRIVHLVTTHIAVDQVDDVSELSGDDGLEQQRWLTYLSVGRRVLFFLVFLLALGFVVSQFDAFRTIGLSLMASAGVATVLLGIAAQPVLGNVVAGLQIAFTKPVRIGDSVVYDGDWGYVEDITYTYLLIQTWDKRRLIVPLHHFVKHPFENWTKRSAHLVKPIYLYADYTVDVDRVRARFDELLREDDDWDQESDPVVQVTAVTDEALELRALCSAKDPSAAWDLHCRLREQLAAYLRDLDGGRYLPRRRHVVERDG